MVHSSLFRPERLSEKLLHIRSVLGLSQTELLKRLGLDKDLDRSAISAFEIGKRQPPLLVLLKYARAVNVSLEALVDDELDLPLKLPARKKETG